MPATWHPFGISPATDQPHVRDPSVEGVKGYETPLAPIKQVAPTPKTGKDKGKARKAA